MPHELRIPRWHPARINQWDGVHWAVRARLKAGDRAMVTYYARVQATPKATGKRRVGLTLVLRKGQRAGDPDAYWKSTLDALTHAGLLVDDNRQHVELVPVRFERQKPGGWWGTVITLEDIP